MRIEMATSARQTADATGCPVCGRPYAWSIPTRMDRFAVGRHFRHHARGRVYFHEIEFIREGHN